MLIATAAFDNCFLKVPEHEPVWQMLMTLKNIVDLVMSPVHTEESICYLDSLISEHRRRFLNVFPQKKLKPKHHFLEHYPQLIREFGPVAAFWTMRFKAKHSFLRELLDILDVLGISCSPLQIDTNSWLPTIIYKQSNHHLQSQKKQRSL